MPIFGAAIAGKNNACWGVLAAVTDLAGAAGTHNASIVILGVFAQPTIDTPRGIVGIGNVARWVRRATFGFVLGSVASCRFTEDILRLVDPVPICSTRTRDKRVTLCGGFAADSLVSGRVTSSSFARRIHRACIFVPVFGAGIAVKIIARWSVRAAITDLAGAAGTRDASMTICRIFA